MAVDETKGTQLTCLLKEYKDIFKVGEIPEVKANLQVI